MIVIVPSNARSRLTGSLARRPIAVEHSARASASACLIPIPPTPYNTTKAMQSTVTMKIDR
jgi:hypothetical protein